jgi:hypothetical protein
MSRSRLVLATLAVLTFFSAPAGAARSAPAAQTDCAQLTELYQTCHRLGGQADSAQTCEEAADEYVQRVAVRMAKGGQAGRTLAGLVCATGCEDALAGQPPATPQELAEAFCDQPPTVKPQGGRP